MLSIFESLPAGFLECSAQEVHKVVPGPCLIHLKGKREQPLFVSILLHGNEDVGLLAVQQILKKYDEQNLPRSLSIFVGNVDAAAKGLRRLDGQPDYNRVWSDVESEDTEEHRMMTQVVEDMRKRNVFASIDLHNNTGLNPHYACVNRIDHKFFHLATLFSRTVVYFLRPQGVQSMAMSELCPAVTCECGRPGEALGVTHAAEYIEACLHLSEFPEHPVAEHDLNLYHTVATVKVPEHSSFGFGVGDADVQFINQLDHLNFRETSPGTVIAKVKSGNEVPLCVIDEDGAEVEQQYFKVIDGQLQFNATVMPSMFTLDERVIRQDCLCYLMERYPLHY